MFEKSFKQKTFIFGYLFKVQASYWSQNILNIFLGVGVSLYTMVCWLAFKNHDPFLMISGICVGLTRNAMYIHLKTMLDWKNNGVYNRLNMTPCSSKMKNFAVITFNIVSTTVICVFMLCIALIFFPYQRTLMVEANQGVVWAGLILGWFVSYAVGSALYAWIKNSGIAQMVGLLIYFSGMYFLGLGFPFEVVISSDWLNILLYLHPFRFVMNITQAGFANAPDFIISSSVAQAHGWFGGAGVDFGYGGITWVPYIASVGVFAFYSLAFFVKVYFSGSFHSRNKYGKFIVTKTSSRYIHRLKSSNSVEELKMLHRDHLETLSKQSPKMHRIIVQLQREIRLEDRFKRRKKDSE